MYVLWKCDKSDNKNNAIGNIYDKMKHLVSIKKLETFLSCYKLTNTEIFLRNYNLLHAVIKYIASRK